MKVFPDKVNAKEYKRNLVYKPNPTWTLANAPESWIKEIQRRAVDHEHMKSDAKAKSFIVTTIMNVD